ncbi:NADH-quinone oxidoreductase subunit L [Planctomyces sp. SH-PL62]|uniref:NADH-quinone oxidoreductase subunit L n=1 Tax=Planctomyces sp. SH-PL62 TaxID=1636152 RepID=UPI00078EB9DF|nr:NADH-quinone oxidoreductase subunit L [Planctomyces sp. SH-PL62]AMV36529.1 NADH-quinone oxidoreductase subunit L [Planctomyces sp. SH-PL62]
MPWQVGLYTAAVLIPLAAFLVEILFIRTLRRHNAVIATGAIAASCVLSAIGFVDYFLIENRAALAEPAHHQAVEPDAHAHSGSLAWKGSVDWVILETPESDRRLSLPLGVHIDNLAAIMFLMVTTVATLIHVYSMGYMADDSRYPRFFAYLSLFCFSMLGLIAASNLFMIFVFWELVGVCSYLLIGFWYEEKPNADAANKAFVVNRVGDVGMLIGLGILWSALGTFDFHEVSAGLRDESGRLNAPNRFDPADVVPLRPPGAVAEDDGASSRSIPYAMLTIAGLGIFAGCAGKSAQFPLHVWLPDAMAGPTPVSALIHAATMVAAGVYLVARFFPVFTPEVLLYIAYTGGVTLFIAATIAMVQTDYKKVLAYSTISQLGFMMLALGVGGWAAGVFHLLTHAFFKALLFLGAGSVYHSVHTYEMARLGGLRRRMPITAGTMLVGTLAISGVPFFSGFYSKDAILAAALARAWQSPEHALLFVLPVVGAVLTTFYMFRMWFLVFAGEPRGFPDPHTARVVHVGDEENVLAEEEAEHGVGAPLHDLNPAAHAHESEPVMTRPLIALAALSVFAGWTMWLGLPFGTPVLERMIAHGQPPGVVDSHWAHWYAVGTSLLIVALGFLLSALYYGPAGLPFVATFRLSPAKTAARFRPLYALFKNKWYFDELYAATLVRPCLRLAKACAGIDRYLIDGIVDGSARSVELLSRLGGLVDRFGVDGLVNNLATAVYVAGDHARSIQTGRIRNYLMYLALALIGLFAGVYAWVG